MFTHQPHRAPAILQRRALLQSGVAMGLLGLASCAGLADVKPAGNPAGLTSEARVVVIGGG